MRYILSRRGVPITRVLLIESGSRSLIEGLLPHLRATWARDVPIDLITCYNGVPAGLGPDDAVFRVTEYGTPERRKQLIRELRARGYSILGIICSTEPIMTKWKWLIALRLPAKGFVINENGDYFWINREQAGAVWEFCMVRLGLAGEGSLRTIGRLIIFPFALLYLLLYAFAAHSGRIVRQWLHPEKL